MKDWIQKYEEMPVMFSDCFLHIAKLLYSDIFDRISVDAIQAGAVETTNFIAGLVGDTPERVARRIMDRYRTYALEESKRIIQSMDDDLYRKLMRAQQNTESYKPTLQESLNNLTNPNTNDQIDQDIATMNRWIVQNLKNIDRLVMANTLRLTGKEIL